ncbi:sorbosone dehydrogenase family protein [Geobacter sp. DSM 9736]|uniref:PQQ-dependent sugar dehydrogenase n=1 Tax=Geobacter sp. DSM 9736 TaxID=1277350 RepID=UPI000B505154|nr:PQQ-dependent sugar dehydrogenase [Geobacter sp. DSM 9736]SNB45233.1 Glucose/arabinose dehydrogenase, beta-propeller fold [Geobacter sp. DSM 9736]
MRHLLLVTPLLALLVSTTVHAAEKSGWPSVSLEKVMSGLKEPTTITHAGDGSGRLFILERKGTIRIFKDGKLLPKPFLDIRKRVRSFGSEQGLLGLAFPPDFAKNGRFYVNYTRTKGVGDTYVSRFMMTGDREVANPGSEEVLLTIRQPYSNHNGGQLAFGPDGYLYIGTGDGGSGGDPQGNGQNLKTFLGKMLRIDPESSTKGYKNPKGNPFGNEIWAYGIRNAWRFSFDRATGDLFIGDVGQNEWEEIDFQPKTSRGGENYGWNVMEGNHCFRKESCEKKGLTLPVAEYATASPDCSVTGGYVYRGKEFPQLAGIYLYGDFCSGRIRGLRKSGDVWESKVLLEKKISISTFGEDEAGNIYLADYETGDIYRVVGR